MFTISTVGTVVGKTHFLHFHFLHSIFHLAYTNEGAFEISYHISVIMNLSCVRLDKISLNVSIFYDLLKTHTYCLALSNIMKT